VTSSVSAEAVLTCGAIDERKLHVGVRKHSDGSFRERRTADSIPERGLTVAGEQKHIVQRLDLLHRQDIRPEWRNVLRLLPEAAHTTVPGDQAHASPIVSFDIPVPPDPQILGGTPCVRGTRLSVELSPNGNSPRSACARE